MTNTLDVDLHDHEQDDEIALLVELMVLASSSDGPLDPSTVDTLLGRG